MNALDPATKPVGRCHVWRMPAPSCEVRISGLAEVAAWLGMDYHRIRRALVHMQTDANHYDSPEADALRREFPELCERVSIPRGGRA